jgi:hypothetical protein
MGRVDMAALSFSVVTIDFHELARIFKHMLPNAMNRKNEVVESMWSTAVVDL